MKDERIITTKKYLLLGYRVSRVKFWLYLGGTYLVGYAAGVTRVEQFYSIGFFLHLVYFMTLANVFLYGVNDYYDEDTDKLNDKKGNYEHLLKLEEREQLEKILFGVFLVSVLFVFYQSRLDETLVFSLFVFLSYYYSAPKLRFKARPFLDFISNSLYVLPGILGYLHSARELPSIAIIIGLCFWTFAMHLFSAIPDILADKSAGIKTSAVVLGKNVSLIICVLFWSIFSASIIIYSNIGALSFLTLIYPLIPLFLLLGKSIDIKKIYWTFPYLNGIFGFLLFWYLVINK
jgi:4-hydroxybenzoate polyprenyltransferase